MRKVGLIIFTLIFISCQLVPLTGRRQLHLIPQAQILSLSYQEYNRFSSTNKVISDGRQADLVKKVGRNIQGFGVGSSVGVVLPYSRLQETEADRLGLIFMAMAGYDPHVAVSFWTRMAEQSKGEPPEFLSTHPSDRKRIKGIKKHIPEAVKYAKK